MGGGHSEIGPELRTGRLLLIAASSRAAADRYAGLHGLEPVAVVDRSEAQRNPFAVRRRAEAMGIDRVAIHSVDWKRQVLPHAYELAALAVPRAALWILDEASGAHELSRREARGALARVPGDVAGAAARVARGYAEQRAGERAPGALRERGEEDSLLAVWTGEAVSGVGGAITHMSGILGGFRARGFRIGLVTHTAPPPQIAAVVDDVEVMRPPRRTDRLTTDVLRLADNRLAIEAGERLAERLPPSFVYQRHRPLMLAGSALAAGLSRPLVLEWNASEAWMRRHWERSKLVSRGFDRLLLQMERRAVRTADLVVAVSDEAAAMAREAGGRSVIVVPNATDVAAVTSVAGHVSGLGGEASPLLGWVGSFGPWHGAEMIVRALAELPPGTRLVMIGDGAGRAECQALAAGLGLDGRVEWTGTLPHREVIERLAGCDVLVSPHVPIPDRPFFGSPTKLFEYMAIGRPVVASRLEQIAEILEDGRTAVLVEPGSLSSLVDGIGAVLGRADGGAALGAAAREEAMAHHDWRNRAEAILARLGTNPGAAAPAAD